MEQKEQVRKYTQRIVSILEELIVDLYPNKDIASLQEQESQMYQITKESAKKLMDSFNEEQKQLYKDFMMDLNLLNDLRKIIFFVKNNEFDIKE